MKKYISKKIILIVSLFITIMLIMITKSMAASLSISTSKSSVSPGESFTVTVSLSNGAGSVSSGGQTQWLDNSSFSYTKTAGNSGSVNITASGTVADYTTEQDQTVSASKTVTIVSAPSSSSGSSSGNSGSSSTTKKPTTTAKPKEEVKKSNDATLKELVVAEETIAPEFNATVKEYSITVPNEVATLNITATPNDSKATVTIQGNEEFVVGENKVIIKVVAEDGTTNEYSVNVTRQREGLALTTLKITYTDKDGNIQEIKLNPEFNPAVLEYSFDEISYLIDYLSIEAIPNLEGAIVEISGNDNISAGDNEIRIKLTMRAEQVEEGQEQPEDEVIEYTIKFTKEATPTLWQKIKDWFAGIGGFISNYYNDNQKGIVVGMLTFCVLAMVGLSIYIAIDAKKYKMLLSKLEKVSEINKAESVRNNIGEVNESGNILEEISKTKNGEKDDIEEIKKGGRHF